LDSRCSQFFDIFPLRRLGRAAETPDARDRRLIPGNTEFIYITRNSPSRQTILTTFRRFFHLAVFLSNTSGPASPVDAQKVMEICIK
jgi:hypothetical protein